MFQAVVTNAIITMVVSYLCLIGFGGSAMLITSLSITAELVGDNVESSAFIYGAMSFTDKLSTGKNISHKYKYDTTIVIMAFVTTA
jgi:hypothetical protein